MEEKTSVKIKASIVHKNEEGEIVEERDVGTSTLHFDEFREKVSQK